MSGFAVGGMCIYSSGVDGVNNSIVFNECAKMGPVPQAGGIIVSPWHAMNDPRDFASNPMQIAILQCAAGMRNIGGRMFGTESPES
jgi:hypothetical protein